MSIKLNSHDADNDHFPVKNHCNQIIKLFMNCFSFSKNTNVIQWFVEQQQHQQSQLYNIKTTTTPEARSPSAIIFVVLKERASFIYLKKESWNIYFQYFKTTLFCSLILLRCWFSISLLPRWTNSVQMLFLEYFNKFYYP